MASWALATAVLCCAVSVVTLYALAVVEGRHRSLRERVEALEKVLLLASRSPDQLEATSRDLDEVIVRSEAALSYLETCGELDAITPSVPPMLPEARAEQSRAGRNLYLLRKEAEKSLRASQPDVADLSREEFGRLASVPGGAVGPDSPVGRAGPTGVTGGKILGTDRPRDAFAEAELGREECWELVVGRRKPGGARG
jgi:hypothetical protein